MVAEVAMYVGSIANGLAIIVLNVMVITTLRQRPIKLGKPWVFATCPKCGISFTKEYSFWRPRKGKCPRCGAEVKYEKRERHIISH